MNSENKFTDGPLDQDELKRCAIVLGWTMIKADVYQPTQEHAITLGLTYTHNMGESVGIDNCHVSEMLFDKSRDWSWLLVNAALKKDRKFLRELRSIVRPCTYNKGVTVSFTELQIIHMFAATPYQQSLTALKTLEDNQNEGGQ